MVIKEEFEEVDKVEDEYSKRRAAWVRLKGKARVRRDALKRVKRVRDPGTKRFYSVVR